MQPSLNEFKLHLRITSNDQDALLMQYLKAAAVSAEHHIGRCLQASVYRFKGDFTDSVSLERIDDLYPLEKIVSVKVDGQPVEYQENGKEVILHPDVSGKVVEIEYIAHGASVEPDIKAAILLTAAKFYNDPVDSVETLPSVATNLLSQYRTWGVKRNAEK